MAMALLNPYMREVWLAVLKLKPKDNTWERLDAHMGVHYSAMDKTPEAPNTGEPSKVGVTMQMMHRTWATQRAALSGVVVGLFQGCTLRSDTI